MISKVDGYRRSVGKEKPALDLALRFFSEVVGLEPELVTNKWENMLSGDLRFASGLYAECKGQPIDPYRYDKNFVEVCERTSNPDLAGGMESLASILGMTEDELSRVSVWSKSDRSTSEFGYRELLHNSLVSVSSSRVTLYVNHAAGHIYVYGRNEIILSVSSVLRQDGMVLGAGMSNEDTFGAMIPHPAMRWEIADGLWSYFGPPGGQWGAERIFSVL